MHIVMREKTAYEQNHVSANLHQHQINPNPKMDWHLCPNHRLGREKGKIS